MARTPHPHHNPNPPSTPQNKSGRGPPAHPDGGVGGGPGAGAVHRGRHLPVPPARLGLPGPLRRGPLQPHQLQSCRAGGEEHSGVRHGAERAARVTERTLWLLWLRLGDGPLVGCL
ncbi:hypothetical protein NHX12_032146 [Muraenolepis orangiensis]|uniref:Uncharacterized protein n=1 Tax=Muraenolepis orangiensis TaxID=630683 RepID=A0A9Q0E8T9_9TELE|nr:hypothetical protein NHX12_032146 [Muraenolepis orangiensis]